MNTSATTLRLVTTRSRRREPAPEEQLVVTVQPDDRLLLSVPEAARRLGISRSLFYELIAAGEIQTLHIGRLCKVSTAALDNFIEGRRIANHG